MEQNCIYSVDLFWCKLLPSKIFVLKPVIYTPTKRAKACVGSSGKVTAKEYIWPLKWMDI